MRAKSAEDVFATRGFQNWKLIANTVFRYHELGAFHKETVERIITLPEATTDIGVHMYIAVSCRNFFAVTNDVAWDNCVKIVTSILNTMRFRKRPWN